MSDRIMIVPSIGGLCSWLDDGKPDVPKEGIPPDKLYTAVLAAECGQQAEYVITDLHGSSAELCLAHATAARVHPEMSDWIATLRQRECVSLGPATVEGGP